MKKLFLLLNFCSIFHSIVFGQGKWELKRDENGIEVYTRKPLTGNFKEIRVLCEFAASKTQLIETLQDINHYYTWVYSTNKNEVLNGQNPNHVIYHSISHLPWPLKDRDLIVELNILPESNNQFQIQAKSLPDYLPRDAKYVRVPFSFALWKVTILDEHKLKIDYTFSVDPGGSIPTWLVNTTLAIGPYNSFLKLKEALKNMNGSKTNN